MRGVLILVGMVVFLAFAWFFTGMLSPDAVAMAIGLLFGVLAGIPTALLLMANNRNSTSSGDGYEVAPKQKYDFQPPVVILDNSTHQHTHNHYTVTNHNNLRLDEPRQGLPALPPLPSQHRAITVEQPVRNQQNRELMVRR